MAITIDATAGGAAANSYVTLAEAETYMEGRLNASTWDSASDDTKNRALAEATRDISTLAFQGYRVTDTQALAWPRQWAPDPDNPVQGYFATTVVPQRIKDFTMELAWQYIRAGTTDLGSEIETDQIIEEKVDVLSTKYAEPYMRETGLARHPRFKVIRPLLGGRASVNRTVVRG